MSSRLFLKVVALIAAMVWVGMLPVTAQATEYTWSQAAGGNWTAADPWDPWGTGPAFTFPSVAGDVAIFGGAITTPNAVVTVDTPGYTVGALKFMNTALGMSLTGSALTLNDGNPSTNAQILVAGTNRANQYVRTNLVLEDNLDLVNNSAKTLTISGNISTGAIGTSNIAKSGAGTVVLSGANTFSGGISMLGGVLRTDTAAALGNGANQITLDGGTWQVGNTMFVTNPVMLGAAGGTIDVISGTNYANSKTTPIDYALALQGLVDGAGPLNKIGLGTLILTHANTYAGPTNINAGVVRITDANALNPTSGGAVNVNAGGRLDISILKPFPYGGSSVDLRNVVVNAGGALRLYGDIGGQGNTSYAPTGQIMGALEVGGLDVDYMNYMPKFTMGQGSTFRFVNIWNDRTYTGPIELAGDTYFDFGSGKALYLNNVISGPGALIKLGGNSAFVRGPNTLTGPVIADASGAIEIRDYGTLFNTSGITVMGGATFRISQADTKLLNRFTASVTLNNGTFEVYQNASSASASIVPQVIANADSVISARRESGTAVTMANMYLGDVTHNPGSRVVFAVDNVGGANNLGRIFLTTVNGQPVADVVTANNGIIGGWAVVANGNNNLGTALGVANDFATYDAVKGVVPYGTIPGQAYNTGTSIVNNPTANYKPNGVALVMANATINSLVLAPGAGYNLTIGTGVTLNIASGGLIKSSGTGVAASTISGGILTAGGTGPMDLVLSQASGQKLTISSQITNNVGKDGTAGTLDDGVVTLVKGGASEVQLENPLNSFSGGVVIGSGTLTSRVGTGTKSGSTLGPSTNMITMEGGRLNLYDNVASGTGITYGNNVTIINNAQINVDRVDTVTGPRYIALGALNMDAATTLGIPSLPGRTLNLTDGNNYALTFTNTTMRGTIQVSNATAVGNPFKFGPTQVNGPSTFAVNDAAGFAEVSALTGAGTLTKTGVGTLSLTTASPSYAPNITVLQGLLNVNVDGAAGTGRIQTTTNITQAIAGAQVNYVAPQTTSGYRADIVAGTAISGDLTGATYGPTALNISPGAIVVEGTTAAPGRANVGGTVLYLGSTNNAGTYTVGDDGARAYRGVAFGRWSPGGDFSGTIASDSNADIDIYLAADKQFKAATAGTAFPALNSATGIVNVYGPGTLTLAANGASPGASGAWTVMNRYGDPSSQSSPSNKYMLAFDAGGAVTAGQTINLYDGRVKQNQTLTSSVLGTVNIGRGATLVLDNTPTSGAFNILDGGALFVNDGTRLEQALATYTTVPGGLLLFDNGTAGYVMDTGQPKLNAIMRRMDIVTASNVASFVGGIVLGEGRRFTGPSDRDVSIAAVSAKGLYADQNTTNVIISASEGRNVNLFKEVDLWWDRNGGKDPAKVAAVQVGDDQNFVTIQGGGEVNRASLPQTGVVSVQGVALTSGGINLKSGSLWINKAASLVTPKDGTGATIPTTITMSGNWLPRPSSGSYTVPTRFYVRDDSTATNVTIDVPNPINITGGMVDIGVERNATANAVIGNYNGLVTLGGNSTLVMRPDGNTDMYFKGGIRLAGDTNGIQVRANTAHIQTTGITQDVPGRALVFGDLIDGLNYSTYRPTANFAGWTVSMGEGTLSVEAAGTYTGGTTVNSGTLTGTVQGAFGTGPVTVNRGTMNMNFAVDTGDTLSPISYTVNGVQMYAGTLNLGQNTTDGQRVIIGPSATVNVNGGRLNINGRAATATPQLAGTVVTGTINATGGGRVDIGAGGDDTKNRVDVATATLIASDPYSVVTIRPRNSADITWDNTNLGTVSLSNGGGLANGGARTMTLNRDITHTGEWVLASFNNTFQINSSGAGGADNKISDTTGLILRAMAGEVQFKIPQLTLSETWANGNVRVEPRGGVVRPGNDGGGRFVFDPVNPYTVRGWGQFGGNDGHFIIVPAVGATVYADDSMLPTMPVSYGYTDLNPSNRTLTVQGQIDESAGTKMTFKIGDNDGIRLRPSGSSAANPYVVGANRIIADPQTQFASNQTALAPNFARFGTDNSSGYYVIANKSAFSLANGTNLYQINSGNGTVQTDLSGSENVLISGSIPWFAGQAAPPYTIVSLGGGAKLITTSSTFTVKQNELFIGTGSGATFLAPYGSQITQLQANGLFDISGGANSVDYLGAYIVPGSKGVLRLDGQETTVLQNGGDLQAMELAWAGAPTTLQNAALRVAGPAGSTVTVGPNTIYSTAARYAPGVLTYPTIDVQGGTLLVKTTNPATVQIDGASSLKVDRNGTMDYVGGSIVGGKTAQVLLTGGNLVVEGMAGEAATWTVNTGATFTGKGRIGHTGNVDTFINRGTVTASAFGTLEINANTIDASTGGNWNYAGGTLYLNGALIGAGYTLNANQAGTMILGKPATYDGGTVVSAGVLRIRDTASLPAGGSVILMGGAPTITPGLLGGLSTVASSTDFTTPNTGSLGIVTGPTMGFTTVKPPWGDNQTYVYTGEFYTKGGPVSWETDIDDTGWVMIDGEVWFGDGSNHFINGTRTLTAGWHQIEIRVGNGTGGAGPTRGAPGVGVDMLGRNSTNRADYVQADNTVIPWLFRQTPNYGYSVLSFEHGHTGASWTTDVNFTLMNWGGLGGVVDEVATGATPLVNQINNVLTVPDGNTLALVAERGAAANVPGKVYFPNISLGNGSSLWLGSVGNAGVIADVAINGPATIGSDGPGGNAFVRNITGTGSVTVAGTSPVQLAGTTVADIDVTNMMGAVLNSTQIGADTTAFVLGGHTISLKGGATSSLDIRVDPGTGVINNNEAIPGVVDIFAGQNGAGNLGTGLTINLANGAMLKGRVDEAIAGNAFVNRIRSQVVVGTGTALDAVLAADRGAGGNINGVTYFTDVHLGGGSNLRLLPLNNQRICADLTLDGSTATVTNTTEDARVFLGAVSGGAGAKLTVTGTNRIRFVGPLGADIDQTVSANASHFATAPWDATATFNLNGHAWNMIGQGTNGPWIDMEVNPVAGGTTGTINQNYGQVAGDAWTEGSIFVYYGQDGIAGPAGWGSGLAINKNADAVTCLRLTDVAMGNAQIRNILNAQVNINAASSLVADRTGGASDIQGLGYFTNVHIANGATLRLGSNNNEYLKADVTLDGATATIQNGGITGSGGSDTRILLGNVSGAATDLTLAGGNVTHILGTLTANLAIVSGKASLDAGAAATVTNGFDVLADGELSLYGTTAANVTLDAKGIGVAGGSLIIGSAGFTGGLTMNDASKLTLAADYSPTIATTNAVVLIAKPEYSGTLTINDTDPLQPTLIGGTGTDSSSITGTITGTAGTVNFAGGNRYLTIGRSGLLTPVIGAGRGVTIARDMAFASDNTYDAGTTINSGTPRALSAQALGSGTVTVNGGATLELRATGFTVAGGITLNAGAPASTLRAYRDFAAGLVLAGGSVELGDAVFPGLSIAASGPLTDSADTSYLTRGGTLTFASGISLLATRIWTVDGTGTPGTVVLNGDITGTQTLTKAGLGTLVLNGNNTAGLSGLNVNQGALVAGSAASAPASNVIIGFGAVYSVVGNHAYGEVDMTTSSGVIGLSGANAQNLTFVNPGMSLGAHTDSTYNALLTPALVGGIATYRLGGGGALLTVASALDDVGGNPTNLEVVSDPLPYGAVRLNAENKFTGTANLNGHTIMGNALALGGSGVLVNVNAGGSVDLNLQSPLDLAKFVMQGGGVANSGGTLTTAMIQQLFPSGSDYILGGAGSLNTDVQDGALTAVSYQERLIKVGTDQVTLVAAVGLPLNNYPGETRITNGTLSIPNLSSIGTSSGVAVTGNGVLDVPNGGTYNGPVTLTGSVDRGEVASIQVPTGQAISLLTLSIGDSASRTAIVGGGTVSLGDVGVAGTTGAEMNITAGSTLTARYTTTQPDRAFRIRGTLDYGAADPASTGNCPRIGWLYPAATLKIGANLAPGSWVTTAGHFGLTFEVDPAAGPAGWSSLLGSHYNISVGSGTDYRSYDAGADGGLRTAAYTDIDGATHTPTAFIEKFGDGTLKVRSGSYNPASGDVRKMYWIVSAGTLEASGGAGSSGLGATAYDWVVGGRNPGIAIQHLEGIEVQSGATLAWQGQQGFLPSSAYGVAAGPEGDGFNSTEFVLNSGATLRGADTTLHLGFQYIPTSGVPETYLLYPTIKGAGTAALNVGGSVNFHSGMQLSGPTNVDVTVTGGDVRFSNDLPGAVGVDVIRNVTIQAGSGRFMNDHLNLAGTTLQGGSLDLDPGAARTMAYNGNVQITGGNVNVRSGTVNMADSVITNTGPGSIFTAGLTEGRLAGAFNTTNPNPGGAIRTSPYMASTTAKPPWGDNETWVYTGEIYIPTAGNVSFAENIDDSTLLKIDDQTVLNDGTWDNLVVATRTLTAGWHTFEARFGNGTSGAGPAGTAGWNASFGFGVDFLGRNSYTQANYVFPVDNGSMNMFRIPTYSGVLTVDQGATLNVRAFRDLSDVKISGTLVHGDAVSVTKALTIAGPPTAPTGKLDLGVGRLVVDYADPGASPAGTIQQLINAGRAADAFGTPTWTGNGITSSAAAANVGYYSVGYFQNKAPEAGGYTFWGGDPDNPADPNNVTVDETSVLVRYTWAADINLDGRVNDGDATILGALYDAGLTSGHTWQEGDLNGDGLINDADATILGALYPQGLLTLGPAPVGGSSSLGAVPEPATLALLGLGAVAALARRRRRG